MPKAYEEMFAWMNKYHLKELTIDDVLRRLIQHNPIFQEVKPLVNMSLDLLNKIIWIFICTMVYNKEDTKTEVINTILCYGSQIRT